MSRPRSLRRVLVALAGCAALTLVALEIVLRLAGGIYRLHQNRGVGLSAADEKAWRILCLGESTTANGGRDSYPSQLEEILNERGQGRRFRVFNQGLPGRDTATILSRLAGNLERYRPNMVVTMMGINDRPETVVHETGVSQRPDAMAWIEALRVAKLAKLVRSRLAKLLGDTPRDPAASTALGWSDLTPQNVNREVLRGSADQAPTTEPRDSREAVALAYRELSHGRHDQAERWLRRALELDPDDVEPRLKLGEFYCGVERFEEGERVLEAARARAPSHAELHFTLANCYREHRRYTLAEPIYWRSIELDPQNIWPYVDLSISYAEQNRFAECEGVLERGLAADPEGEEGYLRLADCYWADDRFLDAAHTLERLMRVNPRNDLAYGKAARCYQRLGDETQAAHYLALANQLRLADVNPATVANYRELARILAERHIPLVAVQYPTRPVALLDAVLGEIPVASKVDNEAAFRDAIDREGYDALFQNRFAGDFGHGTRRGNHLLAEQVAEAVWKVVEPARPTDGSPVTNGTADPLERGRSDNDAAR